MTNTKKKLIVAAIVVLATATAIGTGIHLIAGEGNSALDQEDAKAIALAHAGFSEAEVTLKKVELDRDNGRIEYEVEFRKDGIKYEYEIDAESGEIVAYDQDVKYSATTDSAGAPTVVTTITAEEAKAIALAHAGLTEAEVTFQKVKLDRDDGRSEYEIEFRTDNLKYEYEIDAESGDVRSYDRETAKSPQTTKPQTSAEANQPVAPEAPAVSAESAVSAAPAAPTEPATPTPSTTVNPPVTAAPTPVTEAPVSKSISAEEAKAIALAYAGLSEAEVTFTKIELDRDDGRIEYEIEFRQGMIEYECDIDAESGKILDFEKDYDD